MNKKIDFPLPVSFHEISSGAFSYSVYLLQRPLHLATGYFSPVLVSLSCAALIGLFPECGQDVLKLRIHLRFHR